MKYRVLINFIFVFSFSTHAYQHTSSSQTNPPSPSQSDGIVWERVYGGATVRHKGWDKAKVIKEEEKSEYMEGQKDGMIYVKPALAPGSKATKTKSHLKTVVTERLIVDKPSTVGTTTSAEEPSFTISGMQTETWGTNNLLPGRKTVGNPVVDRVSTYALETKASAGTAVTGTAAPTAAPASVSVKSKALLGVSSVPKSGVDGPMGTKTVLARTRTTDIVKLASGAPTTSSTMYSIKPTQGHDQAKEAKTTVSREPEFRAGIKTLQDNQHTRSHTSSLTEKNTVKSNNTQYHRIRPKVARGKRQDEAEKTNSIQAKLGENLVEKPAEKPTEKPAVKPVVEPAVDPKVKPVVKQSKMNSGKLQAEASPRGIEHGVLPLQNFNRY
ncbi:uncharacterized protein VTP21DRAFT_2595 [Calcarisporiella thermophila]|uniref:uncharacterized protein n=1 Tax=Calcarisporiella thermophila TaxID=911321 RepID=UPI0037445D2B